MLLAPLHSLFLIFAEHFADDLEVSLEADMGEAFNVELEDDSAREACPVLAKLHYS